MDRLGLYTGYVGVILRLYWDNGKENGIYYLGFRGFNVDRLGRFLHLGVPFTPIMENQMEKKMENEMDTGVI